MESVYRDIVEHQVDMVCRYLPDTTLTFVNRAFAEFYGHTPSSLVGSKLIDIFPEPERGAELARLAGFGPGQTQAVQEDWEPRHDGEIRWFQWTDIAILDAAGDVCEFQSVGRDITERRRAMLVSLAHARILEQVASGEPLADTLQSITRTVEELAPGLSCSIALHDAEAGVLRPVATGSLPPRFVVRVGEIPVGPGVGSCGTAAYVREPVMSPDVCTDPAWVDYADLMTEHGFASSWSTPLFSSHRRDVLGVIAVYGREVGEASAPTREIIETFARISEVAIERKQFEERLTHQSLHDVLTGLPNRALFLDRLELAVARSARSGRGVAVLFLDLDGFKDVNDGLGHDRGDELLVAVAARFLECTRRTDTVARFGGDEFVVLLEDIVQDDVAIEAIEVANRLLHALSDPFVIGEAEMFIGASVGIALLDRGHTRPEDLLRDADVAMYDAKRRGSRVSLFDRSLRERAVARHATFNALHRAVERGELVVHYQPIVAMASSAIVGAEALVRWRHPERGLVPPGEFIPVAEQSHLIVGIGRYVIEESVRLAAQHAHRTGAPFVVSVNLSARQLLDPGLVGHVQHVLDAHALAPANLCLEITESVLMREPDASLVLLEQLHDIGVRLAVDDFGTGYSSLAYLKRFPVDSVKIDREFVDGLPHDASDSAIVAAVISLAHALGLGVVAEGVETTDQLRALAQLGCDQAQGFLLARPTPVAHFADLVISGDTVTERGAALDAA